MKQNLYETIIIIDPQLDQAKIEELVNKIQKIITDSGGSIRKVDQWGKKRMAYEIKKKQYGYYVYFFYESDGSVIDAIGKDFRLNESILRDLTVKLDMKAVRQMEKGKIVDFRKFGRMNQNRMHRANA